MASAPPTRSRHLRTPSAPVSTQPHAHAPAQIQAPSRLRPVFNNQQQHYSPAKSLAPKTLTASYLAPPSPSKRPANVAASAETTRLQAELLQLHLLHRDAGEVDERWRASARGKLCERFGKLGDGSREVGERERKVAERQGVLALRSWAAAGGEGLEERIQVLEGVVNGLWGLSEPSGRYARVVRRFGRWIDGVCGIEEARRECGSASRSRAGQDNALFVEELDAAWKDECAAMVRRLDGWRVQLRDICPLPDEDVGSGAERSGVARMLEAARSMVRDMLAELGAMEEMERVALAREERWIEEMIRDEDGDDTPRAGATWRVVY